MGKTRIFAAAAIAAIVLTGCVYAPNGGARYAFYDGYYGPYHGGFWSDDGNFYYFIDASHAKYARDAAHHFVREVRPGFEQVASRRPRGVHSGHDPEALVEPQQAQAAQR